MSEPFPIHRSEKCRCEGCGWSGPGSHLKIGGFMIPPDEHDGELLIDCPNCHRNLTYTTFSDFTETFLHGSETERAFASNLAPRREKYLARVRLTQDRWRASLLKDTAQLPEIPDDRIVLILQELQLKPDSNDVYVVISHKRKVIWKELRKDVYWERFIELGSLLKQKYVERLIDIVFDTDLRALYGRYGQSDEVYARVGRFRRSLNPSNPIEAKRPAGVQISLSDFESLVAEDRKASPIPASEPAQPPAAPPVAPAQAGDDTASEPASCGYATINESVRADIIEMIGLYAKEGVTTFEGFAQHLHADMPEVWDPIKRYLHYLWNVAAIDNPSLDDPTRAQAASVIEAVEGKAKDEK